MAVEEPYFGFERRKANRRVTLDRRQDIRFEPTKMDRRQSPGRRRSDQLAGLWRKVGV